MRALAIAVLTCVACCADHPPIVQPGQIVVDGDTRFQTREGNAIEVTTIRRLHGHEATGAATLHGLALDDARRSPLARVAAGRAWHAIASALAAQPAAAYDAARKGIAELGTAYRSAPRGHHNVIDDTGSTLRLAERAAAQGDVATAARLAGETLQLRLDAYQRVFRDALE